MTSPACESSYLNISRLVKLQNDLNLFVPTIKYGQKFLRKFEISLKFNNITLIVNDSISSEILIKNFITHFVMLVLKGNKNFTFLRIHAFIPCVHRHPELLYPFTIIPCQGERWRTILYSCSSKKPAE